MRGFSESIRGYAPIEDDSVGSVDTTPDVSVSAAYRSLRHVTALISFAVTVLIFSGTHAATERGPSATSSGVAAALAHGSAASASLRIDSGGAAALFIARDSSAALRIEASNEYGGQPQSISRGLYSNIDALVEPHRATVLTLVGAGASSEGSVAWSIVDASDDGASSLGCAADSNATTLNCTFTRAAHVFIATARVTTTGSSATLRATCKYVRREFRVLRAPDREKYVSALAEMYRHDEQTGRALYGDGFTPGSWFTRWHLGSSGDVSPYHAAPSFFTAHAAFGSVLETSLQARHAPRRRARAPRRHARARVERLQSANKKPTQSSLARRPERRGGGRSI